MDLLLLLNQFLKAIIEAFYSIRVSQSMKNTI